MQIGTQTNSLQNHLYSRMVVGQPDPEVGMGATLLSWTDRSAATIRNVFKIGKAVAVTVTEDDALLVSGDIQSETQRYTFATRTGGYQQTFRQAANGAWQEVRFNSETRRWNRVEGGGNGLRIGERLHYRDLSF